MKPESATTQGIHHLGLTVQNLDQTADFFMDMLGFKKVGEKPDYPAVFISDGHIMLTLWQVKYKSESIAFDRTMNIGLHHFALNVKDEESLNQLYKKLSAADNIKIEFAPEAVGAGPKRHMMITEPGGIRIEFIADSCGSVKK